VRTTILTTVGWSGRLCSQRGTGFAAPLAAAMVWLALAPAAYARPEFLARFVADPFARTEKAMCFNCHINPKGGGPRNSFGQAFAKNGFKITAELRQQWPDRFQSTKTAQVEGRPVKVIWSSAKEEESVVQFGDEYFLMNRAEGTMTKINTEQAKAFEQPPAPAAAAAPVEAKAQKPADDLDSRTLPTFDYYLVDLPTNRPRPAGELSLRFSHRFSTPLTGVTGEGGRLFGLDSSSVSSFGVEYAITNWLAAITYRMPDQTIEAGMQIHMLEQGKRHSPLGLSLRATLEGESNFTDRYTTNFQPVISRAFGTRAEVFVDPTFSLGVPRRTLTPIDAFTKFGIPLTPGESHNNMIGIGNGISVRIRPKVALVAEWFPKTYGFRLDNTTNTYSFGIQRRTNRHVFGLIVTNNLFSSTERTMIGGSGGLRIGFNIERRIF
jgi:hypothetical protein